MIVISDTTPLISLMKIGQLELLNLLFGEVQIPTAVFKELVSNSRFPEESRQIRECKFIKEVEVINVSAVNLLRRSTGLDEGESEAIVLSDSIHTSLLLVDEMKGRQVAMQMGIQIMGTIGVLLAANREKLLSREEVMNCIRILKITRRHISDKLYEQLIEKLSD